MLSRRKQGWCVNVTLRNLRAKTCQDMYPSTHSFHVQKQSHTSYSLQIPPCVLKPEAYENLTRWQFLQEYLHLYVQRVEVTHTNLRQAGVFKAEHSARELKRGRCSYSISASPANRWIHMKQRLVRSLTNKNQTLHGLPAQYAKLDTKVNFNVTVPPLYQWERLLNLEWISCTSA
jgi:hypothetical protein